MSSKFRVQQHFLTIVDDMSPQELDALILNGFDVNGEVIVDEIKMSPLGVACFLKSHPCSVDTLLCHGANVEVGMDSLTPLEMLVSQRQTEPPVDTPEWNVYHHRMRVSAKTLVTFGAEFKFSDDILRNFQSTVSSLLD